MKKMLHLIMSDWISTDRLPSYFQFNRITIELNIENNHKVIIDLLDKEKYIYCNVHYIM